MVELKVCESKEELADAAAQIFMDLWQHDCAMSVAVSGGSTPGPAYEKISKLDIDWTELSIWWVDERFVPPTDDASNEKLVRDTWLSKVHILPEQIHPMYRPGDPAKEAVTYESEWIFELGDDKGVDIAFMGIGADGHTASLVPGDQASMDSDSLVVATTSPSGVAQRLTLTKKALSLCGELVFLATGKEKAPYVKAMIDGTGDWPCCQVARAAKKVTLLVDKEAMG